MPAMAIPSIVLLVPQFKLMSVDLVDARWSVIVLYVGIMLPMAIYILPGLFQGVAGSAA